MHTIQNPPTKDEIKRRKQAVLERFLRISRATQKPIRECVAAVDPELALVMIAGGFLARTGAGDPHHFICKLGPEGLKYMGA